MCVYIYIYIHIHNYIWLAGGGAPQVAERGGGKIALPDLAALCYSYNPFTTPNLPTNIVDFGGFDSSTILILRGGILTCIGDFPESLSQ